MENNTVNIVPVMIYTEATPNPATLKFVVNRPLIPDDFVEFTRVEDTEEAPLAKELFGLGNINTIFISQNFVTVTKSDAVMWAEIMIPVKEHLKKYLQDEKPIFTKDFKKVSTQPTNDILDSDTDVEVRIKGALDKYVKPAVEMDGGAISFVSFEDGVLKLALQGSCSGCPSSTITLKQGIESLMMRMVPEVKVVEAVSE